MNMLMLLAPSAVYLAFIAWIVVRTLRQGESASMAQFRKGQGQYSRGVIFLTLAATFVGPSYSLGVIDRAYHQSLLFVLVYGAATLHLIATGLFLVKSSAAPERYKEFNTAGDVLESRFGPAGRYVVGLFTVAQYIAFTSVLCLGGAVVLNTTFGVSVLVGLLVVALFVAIYSMTCGMTGVIRTDRLQFWVMIGLGAVVAATSAKAGFLNGAPSTSRWFNVEAIPAAELAGLLFGFLLGEALQPIYLVRVFLAKNAADAGHGFIRTGLFGLAWFAVFGVCGVMLTKAVTLESGVQGVFLLSIEVVWGAYASVVSGLLVAGLLGVVMSTLDSVLNAGAVSFIDDIYAPLARRPDDETRLPLVRISVLIMAIVGALLASFFLDFVDLLFLAYTLWVPTVVPVLGYAFFFSGPKRSGRLLVAAVGAGLLANFATPSVIASYVPPIIVGFLANALVLALGCWYEDRNRSAVTS